MPRRMGARYERQPIETRDEKAISNWNRCAVPSNRAAHDAFTCAWPCNDEQRARAGWPGYEQSPHIKCFATLCIAEEVPVQAEVPIKSGTIKLPKVIEVPRDVWDWTPPLRPRPDQLIKPTYNGGPPEPYYKPRPLTPEYVEWLRKMNYLPPEE